MNPPHRLRNFPELTLARKRRPHLGLRAYVGITTPTTDGRTERLAPGVTTSVFNTERDFDCRLNAVTGAINDGARLLQFAQSKELTMTVPADNAPAEAKELCCSRLTTSSRTNGFSTVCRRASRPKVIQTRHARQPDGHFPATMMSKSTPPSARTSQG